MLPKDPIRELSESLSKIPGFGKKSALRVVYYLLKSAPEISKQLGQRLIDLHNQVKRCKICGHFSGQEICHICSDPSRDQKTICVVEQDQDLVTIENSQQYQGLFHVMHGVLSPLDGIGPEKLGLDRLVKRVRDESITEVIIATNPTPEGDTTALYIAKILGQYPTQITRVATGLPVGGDIEYADRLTIARSFQARQPLNN
jgi:recombination protein RecR